MRKNVLTDERGPGSVSIPVLPIGVLATGLVVYAGQDVYACSYQAVRHASRAAKEIHGQDCVFGVRRTFDFC